MLELNKVYCGDCAEVLQAIDDNSIDITVTSPPYDNLRDYNGFVFDFPAIAQQLYRVTKKGGVVVWVVGDATINGSETGTSFRQALKFMELGFNLHDTMIWDKGSFTATGSLSVRYASVFEYMFVLSKGLPLVFNPLKDRKTIHFGKQHNGTVRKQDGTLKPISGKGKLINEYSQRFNIWQQNPVKSNKYSDHPATFPEQLAKDHILSWSNPGDTVLDPMCGSGTTLKMATLNDRNFIGIDISSEYCEIANRRIKEAQAQKTIALEV